jgi:hypothetical protein
MYHVITTVGLSRFVSRILAAIFICSLFSSFSFAQSADVPKIISYQGEVRGSTGIPLSGDQLITVTLYADPYSRHVIWQGQYDVTVTNGLFNVLLGGRDFPLPSADSMDRPLWVGIRFNEGEEMKPLTQLALVPYAMNVPDRSITSAKLAEDVLLAMSQSGHATRPQSGGWVGDPSNGSTSTGSSSAVGGGWQNSASGDYASIIGGDHDTAKG